MLHCWRLSLWTQPKPLIVKSGRSCWQYCMEWVLETPSYPGWICSILPQEPKLESMEGLLSHLSPPHTQRRTSALPLLFAVAIEPLAAASRMSQKVQGFQNSSLCEKVLFYADNMLLFLRDWPRSLPTVMSIISHFGTLLGWIINWDKSLIMPLTSNQENDILAPTCLQSVTSFTYLGIVINARNLKYWPAIS